MSAIELIEKLPVDVIKSMSPDDWIKSAWDAAVEGIVCGSATILGTENGIWRVRCESIETLRSLQGRGEIISRLHRITICANSLHSAVSRSSLQTISARHLR